MIVQLSNDEVACARAVAAIRNGSSDERNGNLVGHGETKDELLHIDFMACLGEIAVAKKTNLYWSGCGKDRDCLADVGNCIEVRSTASGTNGLAVREHDRRKFALPAVLTQVDMGSFAVRLKGWEYMGMVQARGVCYPARPPYWVLRASLLRPMNELLATVMENSDEHTESP